MSRRPARLFAAVRAGYAATLLCSPGPVTRAAAGNPAGPGRGLDDVARVLGARHALQAVITAADPSTGTLHLGAATDAAHAASMAMLAARSRRWRRAGLADMLAASTFAVLGLGVAAAQREVSHAASPQDIRQRVREQRDRLLGGRGPGASPGETAPHMRDRQWLGGVPAAVARQREADQAALAAEDPSAVADVLIRHRAELTVAVSALATRLRTLRTRTINGVRAAVIVAAAGTTAALVAQIVRRSLLRQAKR